MSHPEYNLPGFEGATKDVLEEVLELATALAKMLRFGPYSINPLLPVKEQEANIVWVLREYKDVIDKMTRLTIELREVPIQQFSPAIKTGASDECPRPN